MMNDDDESSSTQKIIQYLSFIYLFIYWGRTECTGVDNGGGYRRVENAGVNNSIYLFMVYNQAKQKYRSQSWHLFCTTLQHEQILHLSLIHI